MTTTNEREFVSTEMAEAFRELGVDLSEAELTGFVRDFMGLEEETT